LYQIIQLITGTGLRFFQRFGNFGNASHPFKPGQGLALTCRFTGDERRVAFQNIEQFSIEQGAFKGFLVKPGNIVKTVKPDKRAEIIIQIILPNYRCGKEARIKRAGIIGSLAERGPAQYRPAYFPYPPHFVVIRAKDAELLLEFAIQLPVFKREIRREAAVRPLADNGP
jgi:hypothetical protein